jgi:hypothetical protein
MARVRPQHRRLRPRRALRQCDDRWCATAATPWPPVTIKSGNIDAFRARLNEIARRSLKPEQFQRGLRLDAEVVPNYAPAPRRTRPAQQTGIGNPPVHVLLRNVTHARPQRMGFEKHAKLWITDHKNVLEAVLWNVGDGPCPGRFTTCLRPADQRVQRHRTVQLKVLDWRPGEKLSEIRGSLFVVIRNF